MMELNVRDVNKVFPPATIEDKFSKREGGIYLTTFLDGNLSL